MAAHRIAPRLAFPVRRVTAHWRRLPEFILIGGQKCGTTSLYAYLSAHPQIHPALKKEVHFFDLNYQRGVPWYRAHFPIRPGAITGESSPYYLFHPLVPARVAGLLPNVRLLVILRDPVARAYSHYFHEKRRGREHLSFEEALSREESRAPFTDPNGARNPGHQYYSYTARGHYAEQLSRWFEVLPRERFCILSTEQMAIDSDATVRTATDFLGLEARAVSRERPSAAFSYPPMDPGTREELRAHFEPHNKALYRLLDRDFGW